MDHTHEYETDHRLGLTPEAEALGLRAAEVRKCKTCGHENTFVFKDKWFPLFDEAGREGKDILMA